MARKFFLDKRLSISESERQAASHRLCGGIFELEEFRSADTVLLFYPSRNEPDLLPLAQIALDMGKSVAFPISLTSTCTLAFRCVSSLDELSRGTYGIYEPSIDAPAPLLSEKTLCVVPALAFDGSGYRLGYGKGYYDRFLADFNGISVGAAYDGFLCPSLPTDRTDIPVDIIITETGVIRTK